MFFLFTILLKTLRIRFVHFAVLASADRYAGEQHAAHLQLHPRQKRGKTHTRPPPTKVFRIILETAVDRFEGKASL
jgi:hypothetical protein